MSKRRWSTDDFRERLDQALSTAKSHQSPIWSIIRWDRWAIAERVHPNSELSLPHAVQYRSYYSLLHFKLHPVRVYCYRVIDTQSLLINSCVDSKEPYRKTEIKIVDSTLLFFDFFFTVYDAEFNFYSDSKSKFTSFEFKLKWVCRYNQICVLYECKITWKSRWACQKSLRFIL